MKTKVITEISNGFTGYSATIRTNGKPAAATVKRHIRKSKCAGCTSVTMIVIDGVRHDFQDFGRGHVELTAY